MQLVHSSALPVAPAAVPAACLRRLWLLLPGLVCLWLGLRLRLPAAGVGGCGCCGYETRVPSQHQRLPNGYGLGPQNQQKEKRTTTWDQVLSHITVIGSINLH